MLYQAANRAAGVGDEQGRLPNRVKAADVLAKCTLCSHEIKETKANNELRQHCDARHPTSTFAICFPTATDPTVPVVVAVSSAPVAAVAPKKKAASNDLSFLDSALDSKAFKGKK